MNKIYVQKNEYDFHGLPYTLVRYYLQRIFGSSNHEQVRLIVGIGKHSKTGFLFGMRDLVLQEAMKYPNWQCFLDQYNPYRDINKAKTGLNGRGSAVYLISFKGKGVLDDLIQDDDVIKLLN